MTEQSADSLPKFVWRTITMRHFWHYMSPFWSPDEFKLGTMATVTRLFMSFTDMRKGKRYVLEVGRWYRPRFYIRTIDVKRNSD